ncbi:sensor histidine kinase [Chitinophaga defluvii]|uniref:histidine kinase n=1 Tax=Chitinophaga defluvii TaxID=3163343 RepID=A0ABV2T161_9BACT
MNSKISNLNIDLQLSILTTIMEQVPCLVAIRDQSNGEVIYINETGIKMLGTKDLSLLKIIMDQNNLGCCNTINDDSLFLKEQRWTNLKGEFFSGIYEGATFQNDYKTYCFFRITDILPDRHFKQQLNKELQRFGALFNYASIGILVTNEQGGIVMINEFALKQFGYSREELVGQKVEMLIPQRAHHKHEAHRQRYNHKPQSRPMGIGLDLFAVRKDGSEFPVEISLSHYQNEEGAFVIAYINNITERKKAEASIEKLNNELEDIVEERTGQLRKALDALESSKEELTTALGKEKELSELKSRFVSMASHEFRTPLSTILSSAFLIKQYTTEADQSKRDKHIQRIVNSIGMLTDTLNDFLSVGKIEEGKIQVRISNFNITEHINAVIQEMQGIAMEGQEILYRHTGEEGLSLDPTLLKHIVMNLLGNAIKFSGPTDTISINTEKNANHFTLAIKDNGIGMSQEDQQHLFERFYRGANASNIQGTGLGLHIVSKYSELMNGSISCESELGTGTIFTIVFSLYPPTNV